MIRKLIRYGHRPWRWSLRTRRIFILSFVVSIPAWLILLVALGVWACVRNMILRPLEFAWNAPPAGHSRDENYVLFEEPGTPLSGAANDCSASTRAA